MGLFIDLKKRWAYVEKLLTERALLRGLCGVRTRIDGQPPNGSKVYYLILLKTLFMLVTKYETKIRELHATRPRSTSVRVRTFQDFARKQPCRGKLPRVIEQTSGLFSLLLRTRVPFPCRERHLGGPISSIFVRELPPGGLHSLLGVQAATDPW